MTNTICDNMKTRESKMLMMGAKGHAKEIFNTGDTTFTLGFGNISHEVMDQRHR